MCSMPLPCHEHNTFLILHTKMLSSFYRSSENLPEISVSEDVSSSRRTCTRASFDNNNNGGKPFIATKGGGRPKHGKPSSHFAIRYVVAQWCHYQRSVAAVPKNVVFGSE